MTRKGLFAVASLVLIIAVVGLFLSSWFTTSTIAISSSPGAKIFVKQGGQNFQEIGTGEATFKTRTTEIVFIEARQDGNATQKSVQPVRRKTIKVSLEIGQPGTAERVASVGPFLYPFIDKGFVYGIASSTSAGYLNVGPLEGTDPANYPDIPFLPNLRQIAWHDVNNFVYITATEGAGVASTSPNLTKSDLPYIGVAAPNTSTTALLSGKGLHLAKGLDIAKAPLISRSKPGAWTYLFADQDFIFFGWTEYKFEEEHEHEGGFGALEETEEGSFSIDHVVLSVFDHKGKEQDKFELPIKSRVLRVASVDKSSVGILADEGDFFLLDMGAGNTQKKDFSLGRIEDMVSFRGKLLLLGASGLWEYDTVQDSYHKIAGYPDGEVYVPYSLSISEGDIYFSTQAEQTGNEKTRPAINSVFRVRLDN